MSTRSILAIPDGDGFKGRYCHSDGYPSWQLPALHRIYTALDGDVEAMVQCLVVDHAGWSFLSATPEAPEYSAETLKDPRFAWVPNVGIAYTTTKITKAPFGTKSKPYQQVSEDEWLEYHGEKYIDTDTEYAYVIDAKSGRVTVFSVDYIDVTDEEGKRIPFTKVPRYIGGYGIADLGALTDEQLDKIGEEAA